MNVKCENILHTHVTDGMSWCSSHIRDNMGYDMMCAHVPHVFMYLVTVVIWMNKAISSFMSMYVHGYETRYRFIYSFNNRALMIMVQATLMTYSINGNGTLKYETDRTQDKQYDKYPMYYRMVWRVGSCLQFKKIFWSGSIMRTGFIRTLITGIQMKTNGITWVSKEIMSGLVFIRICYCIMDTV